jgi:hypothetical protein
MPDKYTSWAREWGRGTVDAFQLPVTKAWAVGSDECHLATFKDPPHVICFASEESARRIVARANRIINGGRKP